MSRPVLEVGDVFRAHGSAYLERSGSSCSAGQRRVLSRLADCRTAALGGHIEQCDSCSYQRIAYNSCRDRHCPKCQGAASREWLDQRASELLDVEYFHVVFTVPQSLAPLALQNPREVYGLLFRATAETLLTIAADPRHLGAQIGFLAVLHTWGQNLHHHPHLHCVIPGGGISLDGLHWIACRNGFFLPVRVLSRLFRHKFLRGLEQAFRKGTLSFSGRLAPQGTPAGFAALLRAARKTEWVVYAKPPFGGPAQVLKYLARYTHRVAIANSRLHQLHEGAVTFGWKDYAHEQAQRKLTLDAHEFIRRFLLHVLPKGFVRIRHFGFLANRHRQEHIRQCRALLQKNRASSGISPSSTSVLLQVKQKELAPCPLCHVGTLQRGAPVAPQGPAAAPLVCLVRAANSS